MPLLRIQTNAGGKTEGLAAKATELLVQELSKPREFVQVVVESGLTQSFAGTTDPNAFVEVRSLGLTPSQAKSLSRAIADLLEAELKIDPKRLFINFFDIDRSMWGWNGGTFA